MNAMLVSLIGTVGAAAVKELVPLAKSGELLEIVRATKLGPMLGLARVPLALALAPAIGVFGAGAAVGLAAGMLVAPRRGAETRQALMNGASDLVRMVRGAPAPSEPKASPPTSAAAEGDKLLS